MRHLFLAVAVLLGATGCTTAISKQSLQLVDPGISFETLRQNPDRHIGRYLLLGGAIVENRSNASGGSELEVVQFPTDARGRITATDHSAGRFIADDATFRDPAVYRPGRRITLVGQVTGSKTLPLGEVDYLYPVLTVHELRLWAPREYPRDSPFHFGIGIGIGGRL